MSRHAPRRLIRGLACMTVPVLLIAGCSSGPDADGGAGGSDGGGKNGSGSESTPSGDSSPSPQAVTFATLPDPCDTLSEDTVDAVVPKAKSKSGKNLGSDDADSQGTCLWSGIRIDDDDYQFRSLSVSLKRYDSEPALGSGDQRAGSYLKQQVAEVSAEEGNKNVKERGVDGLGDKAVGVSFESKKKDEKGDSADYREQRIVVRADNVVLTVDYQGAGFEGSKTPSAEALAEKAEQAARQVVSALRKAERNS